MALTAEALLEPDRLRAEGYFDPVYVRTMFADHLAGRVDAGARLWDVLMFQAWLEEAGHDSARSCGVAPAVCPLNVSGGV